MAIREEIHSDLAHPPGDFLAEVLEDMGMSQVDLARRMGRPPQAINEIIKGTKALTPETALQLEQVVAVPAHIWIGLEAEYRLALARDAEDERTRRETALVKFFPYAELVKLGCLTRARRSEDKVRQLRSYFGVASLDQLGEVRAYAPAFRVAAGKKVSAYALAAWLYCGQREVAGRQLQVFDRQRLESILPNLRALTLVETDQVISQLRSHLAQVGVAFTLFPHFPKTYAHGATFWPEPRKRAVLLMSIRGRYADVFWFSFFHELGHILLHNGDETYVELDAQVGEHSPQENEADRFASDVLIPRSQFADVAGRSSFAREEVVEFSAGIGIHPGIVVGRLHHEGLLPHTHLNGLRERFALQVE